MMRYSGFSKCLRRRNHADSKLVPEQTDSFGGAACVSYSFASNVSSVIVGIADADQLLDNNYPALPSSIPYTICGASNCTSSSTYALNASAGHYYFNITNPSSSLANIALAYTLYPANSSGKLGPFATAYFMSMHLNSCMAFDQGCRICFHPGSVREQRVLL